MTTVSPSSSSPRRRFHFLTLALLTSCLGLTATAAVSASTAPTMTAAQITASAGEPTQELQLADEITRRLRRIGLNFNRARIQRPYDPAGELC